MFQFSVDKKFQNDYLFWSHGDISYFTSLYVCKQTSSSSPNLSPIKIGSAMEQGFVKDLTKF